MGGEPFDVDLALGRAAPRDEGSALDDDPGARTPPGGPRMRFAAEVLVTLKPGLASPQGKAVEGALPTLGWRNVSGVPVGKHVRTRAGGGVAVGGAHPGSRRWPADRPRTRPLEDSRILELRVA